MKRRTILLAGGAIIAGCSTFGLWLWSSVVGRHQRETLPVHPAEFPDDLVVKLPELHGASLDTVITKLGQPGRQLEYKMADSPNGEFRVELYNTYPLGDPKAAEARIKELQWDGAQFHIAVWLHQPNGKWVVLDTCRWKEGEAF